MDRVNLVIRWTLAGLAGGIVGYCVLVMVVVATAPDLRMRFLLAGPPDTAPGIVIAMTIGLEVTDDAQIKPEPGDSLIEIDGKPISTSIDYMREQFAIKSPEFDRGYATPNADGQDTSDGIMVKFRRKTDQKEIESKIKIQSVPLPEVGLTLVWFLLELVIFSVSAVAFWNRPFDDAARLFFAMCTVTLAAFVGGFHWWTLGSNFWLNLPFAVCGMLLPAVILHFFLVYPRPKPPLIAWPNTVVISIYAIPVFTIAMFLIVDGFLWLLMTWADRQVHVDVNSEVKRTLLDLLRIGIYSYICVAAFYFVLRRSP